MSFYRTKINPLDVLVSCLVRNRDEWTCRRCKKLYPPPTSTLHCAHIFSRGDSSTRYDQDNCLALCLHCHQWAHGHAHEFVDFVNAELGIDKAEALRLKSRQTVRKSQIDYNLLKLAIMQEIDRLQGMKRTWWVPEQYDLYREMNFNQTMRKK